MSKSKIAKGFRKALFSAGGLRTAAIIGGSAAGGIAGFSRSQPGLRKAGFKEGAIGGAAAGGILAFSPQIAKFAGRTVKTEARRSVRKVKVGVGKKKKKIKGFFRRGGRVIPIFEKG